MGLEAIWLSVDDILYILVCGWYVFVFDLNRNILKMFDLNRNFLKMFNLNKKFLKIFDLTAQFYFTQFTRNFILRYVKYPLHITPT